MTYPSDVRYIAQTRVVLGKHGVRDRRIVFYARDDEITPYVVHMEVFNSNGEMYRVSGNYCRTFADGWERFTARAHGLLIEEFCDV